VSEFHVLTVRLQSLLVMLCVWRRVVLAVCCEHTTSVLHFAAFRRPSCA
jgi:hypothetical protein